MLPQCPVEAAAAACEVAARRRERSGRTSAHGEDPRCRGDPGGFVEPRLDDRRPLDVTERERRLDLVARELEPAGMTHVDGRRELGRRRQLPIGLRPLAEGQRDEPEEVPVEGGDHDIAALHREPEALLRVPARIVQATLVRRDQPDAAEAPRRVEIIALARVGLQCGLGHVACLDSTTLDRQAGRTAGRD